MIKTVLIPKQDKLEVATWLKENVSAENMRWWVQDNVYIPSPDLHTPSKQGSAFSIDVTEEEEPLLTIFLLKWS